MMPSPDLLARDRVKGFDREIRAAAWRDAAHAAAIRPAERAPEPRLAEAAASGFEGVSKRPRYFASRAPRVVGGRR